MYLEKLLPKDKKHETAVLLVHGAFHGAWMWENNFMRYFSNKGFDTYAVTLSGRGKAARKPLLGLQDLASDLAEAVHQINQPTVIIGHSMGGLVTQKYLEKNQVKGATLLCSVPPYGMYRSISRLLLQTPGNFIKFMGLTLFPSFKGKGKPPTGIYPEDIPLEKVRKHVKRMNSESKRLLIQLFRQTINPQKVKQTPLNILGAEDDGLIFKEEVIATAKHYQLPYKLYPKMMHSISLSHNWQIIAKDILDWVFELDKEIITPKEPLIL